MSSNEAYRGGFDTNASSDLGNKIMSRRAFLAGAVGLVAATAIGGYRLGSGENTKNPQVGGEHSTSSNGTGDQSEQAAIPQPTPTETTVETSTTSLEDDSAMVNPKLERMPGVYKEGETTPEDYLDLTPAEIKTMFHIPSTLLEGRKGEHADYLKAITDFFTNAAKPGLTEEELMQFMRPEFFADTKDMSSEELSILKNEIDMAVNDYVRTMMADERTDAMYEGGIMMNSSYDKYESAGYKMLVGVRATALRGFAEHALKYTNANWSMRFSASNRKEDIRGDSVSIDADMVINVKAWDSNGESVEDSVEWAKLGFMGESNGRGGIETGFLAEIQDEYKSFMGALDQIAQS